MDSKRAHDIKHRNKPNDNFYTPRKLAAKLISLVPLETDDLVLDAALGEGAFFDNFPDYINADCCDPNLDLDFLQYSRNVDWIITNPPYSNLDAWFVKAFAISKKGVAFLLGYINITPRRLEIANNSGFGVTKIHLCKVFQWFGISAFVIFEKGKPNIIEYDRIVWHG